MTDDPRDQDLVASALASAPPPGVSPAFLAKVNARIDADAAAGWLGVLDFRAWTLRLAPLAIALAIIVMLWPGATPASAPQASTSATAQTFTPSSESDWQQEMSPNALLEAAFTETRHGG